MDETWQKVGALSSVQILRLQQTCRKEQEELTGFVIGLASELRPDAMGLVLYAYVVITEAFRKSGTKFRAIKPGTIMRTWEATKTLIASLKEHSRLNVEQYAESVSEPAVFRYTLGAMSPDQEDAVELTDDEFWQILCILQTVSDCLHDSQKSR
jgi:hypothetical protein